MVNIIICEDNLRDANKIKSIVEKYMINVEYKLHIFNDYNRKFIEFLDKEIENKIYLLDIETPSMSGIDVARIIRKNDYTSVIVFLSGHDDLSRIVAKKNIMCLNFINKFDNLDKNLQNTLKLALNVVGKKRILKVNSKGIYYNIELDKINYITRDTVTRETIIVCDNKSYRSRLNLKNICNELNDDFIQIHRACIINNNKVKQIDKKNMCITFQNDEKITLISKKYIDRMIKNVN